MISLALYELRCPSYDYVQRMSWVEFQLRLIAYQRSQKREEMKLRELSWQVYTAPHRDPKKLKKNINSFWPIDGGNQGEVTEQHKAAYLDAWKEYQEKLKEKQDGKATGGLETEQ